MLALRYIYAELVLFMGFILYFIYNIYVVMEIKVKMQSFVKLMKFKESMKNILLEGSYNYFFSLKDFILRNRIYLILRFIVSEKNSLFYISFLCLIALFLYVYQLFWFLQVDILENNRVLLFNSVYVVDGLSIFLKVVISFLAFFFFFLCYHVSFFWKFYRYELGFFIFMVIFSMLLLVSANDFFLVFIVLEVQTASIVILASFQMTQKRSTEGGLKYFIYSSFFSGLFLYSIALVYYVLGTVSFENIYQLSLGGTFGINTTDNIFILVWIFMTSFLFFKLGIFPYHYWIADVYEGSNLLITAFLAVMSKIGLVGLFIRLYLNVFINFYYVWGDFAYYLTLSTMLYGAIAALYQTDVKRFLAYTSISNMGYVLIGFSVGNLDSLYFALFFLVFYLYASLSFFVILLGLVYKEVKDGGDSSEVSDIDFNHITNLRDFQGLYKSNKVVAFSTLFVLLNLMGVPPSSFFVAKYFLFDCFLRYDYVLGIFVFVLVNLISAFYYLRVVKIIFLDRTTVTKSFFFLSKKVSFVFFVFITLNLLFLIYPPLLEPVLYFFKLLIIKFYV
jgi:NADH-quinone oxidoreductase subunit N